MKKILIVISVTLIIAILLILKPYLVYTFLTSELARYFLIDDVFVTSTVDWKYINPITFRYDLKKLGTVGDYLISNIHDHNTILLGKAIIDNVSPNNLDIYCFDLMTETEISPSSLDLDLGITKGCIVKDTKSGYVLRLTKPVQTQCVFDFPKAAQPDSN